MIKVSVVLPIYNVSKYLPKCLDSLLNQTLKEIEIICVNNGSTDSCVEIITELANNDNRIKVIKRVSFGYGNFTHFRNRIMHIINKNTIIKLVDKSQIIRKKRKK